MNSGELVLTFDSTHYALAAEKIIIEFNGITQLIATPRSINSRCGFSLLLKGTDVSFIEKIRENQRLKIVGIFKRQINEGVFYYEKIY